MPAWVWPVAWVILLLVAIGVVIVGLVSFFKPEIIERSHATSMSSGNHQFATTHVGLALVALGGANADRQRDPVCTAYCANRYSVTIDDHSGNDSGVIRRATRRFCVMCWHVRSLVWGLERVADHCVGSPGPAVSTGTVDVQVSD